MEMEIIIINKFIKTIIF